MPTENLAKIFGPTVLGYSSADPDHHAIFTETMIQRDVSFAQQIFENLNLFWFYLEFFTHTLRFMDFMQVMLHLLEIPTDYWARFINVESTDSESQKVSGYSYFGEIFFY